LSLILLLSLAAVVALGATSFREAAGEEVDDRWD
jgi:hypothetical protein